MELINYLFTVAGTITFFKAIFYIFLFVAVIKIYTTASRTVRIEEDLRLLRQANAELLERVEALQNVICPEDESVDEDAAEDDEEIDDEFYNNLE